MSRFAPKMTVEDLKAAITAFAKSKDFDDEYDVEDYDDIENVIATGFMNCAFVTAHDDVQKIRFDYENVFVERFDIMSNGVPFALISAGGDWEVPLVFVFYFDGKQFRGYVPKDGNIYNRTLKQAYGNANEDEDNADAQKHFKVDRYYGLEPDFAKAIADAERRIEARGESGAVYFGGPGPLTLQRERLAATEPDLTVLDVITPDLVMVTAMPAADGSYFTLKLKHSKRELTFAECDKVEIPKNFRREVGYYEGYTWYAPNGMGSSWTAKVMEKAGFAVDPDSYIQDYKVRIYRW